MEKQIAAYPVMGYIPQTVWFDSETRLNWLVFDYGEDNPWQYPSILSYKGNCYKRTGWNSDKNTVHYKEINQDEISLASYS
jgi:hypothetical protein